MDLVAGVRKEGSRGGRDAFKWEDVKDDQHRENYLGHSLMAPVGRWQKNKDLSWYAKGDSSKAATDAANARAEEIRRIKEAEQDALSEALGYPVQPRLRDNQIAGQKEVEKALKETAEGGDEGGKGVGFGTYAGVESGKQDGNEEVMGGYAGDAGGLKVGQHKSGKKEARQEDMSGGEEAEVGAGTETESVTGDIDIMDTLIAGETGTMITGITGGTDQDLEICTPAGGLLEMTTKLMQYAVIEIFMTRTRLSWEKSISVALGLGSRWTLFQKRPPKASRPRWYVSIRPHSTPPVSATGSG
ncbi:MAG: hypothetical protein Q9166_001475 [cf. Caloplaca sp. 2 TL-2023]